MRLCDNIKDLIKINKIIFVELNIFRLNAKHLSYKTAFSHVIGLKYV